MLSIEHKKYIIYLLKYLGVALIAGSVVHVGTLHNGTTRYIVLGIVGLVFMVTGNILESKQAGEKINVKYFLIITALSLATGFFSGGIQHYLDNPGYAGYLLGIGLLSSYIIFFLRDKIKLYARNIILVGIIAIAIVIISINLKVTPAADHHMNTSSQTMPSEVSAPDHQDLPNAPAHTH